MKPPTTDNRRWHFPRRMMPLTLIFSLMLVSSAQAADQLYFAAINNIRSALIQKINAETVRLDVAIWLLSDGEIAQAIGRRHTAGVPVRLIGDRNSIFENDPNTRKWFYYLANLGVPIRIRFNPTWYPEINHWKAAIFVGQRIVAFGSANFTPFEMAPASSTNYKDESVLFSDDPSIVNAFKTKFDVMWNDTTREPQSMISGPPYLKNWNDACASEPTGKCSDFKTLYPNPKPMIIDTGRLEPDNPLPADLIWGQGSSFNNRLIQEINNEPTALTLVVYRLNVESITNALLNRWNAGVQVRVLLEPTEYVNRKWPEFWLTHAYIDKLWAAGIPIKVRVHSGLTHMKTLVTSSYATNASSNYAVAWQRDHDYFMSAAAAPTIYQAMKNRVDTMWNDPAAFGTFRPQRPDAATLAFPASGATAVSTTPTLVWNRAVFATSYDVYLGTSTSNMTKVANVAAQLNNNPPTTYSWPASLQGGTTYFWKIVSRTFATPQDPSMISTSATRSFTTAGSGSGSQTPPPPPPPDSSLPSPWTSQDIGSVGQTGSASYSNGTFTVSGAGADIWGASDSFRYVYQSVSGDTEIVARVASVQNTNAYAKAGIMLRASTAANAAHVILDIKPGGSVEFMKRSSTGGSTSYLAGGSQPPPTWLKMVRSGSTVTGSVSSNGSTWTTIGSTTVSMGSSALAGLAVTSHNTSALNTSTFDNVSVDAGSGVTASSLPSGWESGDIGPVGRSGDATYASGTFTVSGAGADIWGASDSFHYVYQPVSGDAEIAVRVTGIENTNRYAKAGVMLRESLDANAAHVILDVTPGGGIEFMERSSAGESTTFLAGSSQPPPAWLSLVRNGSTVTGYVSSNGSAWTMIDSTTLSIGSAAFAGLAVTSHNTSALNTSTFDNVTANP